MAKKYDDAETKVAGGREMSERREWAEVITWVS